MILLRRLGNLTIEVLEDMKPIGTAQDSCCRTKIQVVGKILGITLENSQNAGGFIKSEYENVRDFLILILENEKLTEYFKYNTKTIFKHEWDSKSYLVEFEQIKSK